MSEDGDVSVGIEAEYELLLILRRFAPYVGISWSRKLGETGDLAEASGQDKETTSYVTGIRFWF